MLNDVEDYAHYRRALGGSTCSLVSWGAHNEDPVQYDNRCRQELATSGKRYTQILPFGTFIL